MKTGPVMRWRIFSALAILALTAAAAPARAQGVDFLNAEKITCRPERVTRCDRNGGCRVIEATEADKNEALVVDFAARTFVVQRGDKARPVGDITEDKMVDGERRFIIAWTRPSDQGSRVGRMVLTRNGKLSGTNTEGGNSFEATCESVPPTRADDADFFTIDRIVCRPDSVTRCDAKNECTTRAATEADRNRPVTIDFAAKRALSALGDDTTRAYVLADERIAGTVRRFTLARERTPERVYGVFELTRSGILRGFDNAGRRRFEATCSKAP